MTPAQRKTAKSRAKAQVVFRGPPDRLATLLPAAAGAKPKAAGEAVATLRGADVRGLSVRALARAGGGARRATLRLPRTTPPGTYEGSAEIEGREVTIVAEVERRPRLESDPRRISVEVEPGAQAIVSVTLLNTGNVACDVSGATQFCLFDGRGVEHAFWLALTTDPPKDKQRIDLLLDDMAASHGGLVTTRVAKGAKIEPGESRAIQLTLRFSDRLQPGQSYAGAWEAEGLRVPVRVTGAAGKPKEVPPKPKRAAAKPKRAARTTR